MDNMTIEEIENAIENYEGWARQLFSLKSYDPNGVYNSRGIAYMHKADMHKKELVRRQDRFKK